MWGGGGGGALLSKADNRRPLGKGGASSPGSDHAFNGELNTHFFFLLQKIMFIPFIIPFEPGLSNGWQQIIYWSAASIGISHIGIVGADPNFQKGGRPGWDIEI